jgi:lactoylglutathione lyase
MKLFYVENFQAKAGNIYNNPKTNFTSCFISFDSGCKLELMYNPDRTIKGTFEHIAISVGKNSEVDRITENLKAKGFIISSGPRVTGDGYYESVFTDPEGNKIEITV